MMRFHCPHCQQVLEVVEPTETFLCPACELWCRIPIPDEFELNREDVREIAPPRGERPYEPTLKPSEPSPHVRPETISERRSEELPLRLRDETDPIEKVVFDVVEDDAERRPKRRRRRRRRSGQGFDLDYWISPALILLFLLVPAGLFVVVLSFFLHPGAGFGAIFMVGGGIWFTFIAAEDGMVTALLVLFVPFYAWYFAFVNFERVALPFVLHCVGAIVFTVSLAVAAMRGGNDWSVLPATAKCVISCLAPPGAYLVSPALGAS